MILNTIRSFLLENYFQQKLRVHTLILPVSLTNGWRTDATWRDGNIDWSLTSELFQAQFNFAENRIYMTQGFIGATVTDQTTTLGREGSDYTAAIIANILNAESVTIWKDVPGIMNADPNK